MVENRIILVDNDVTWRKNMKTILTRSGYWVIGETNDGLSALKLIRSRQPDLLIIAAELSGMDGLEVARIVHEDKLAPAIVVAATYSPGLVEKARNARVAAMLIKPVDETNLFPAIEIALANYQEIISLERQIKDLQEALETRKLVERAKGILIETLGISEAEAFRRIQKQSMNKRISMRQVAEAIILAQSLKT
jgi:response regulator NasT